MAPRIRTESGDVVDLCNRQPVTAHCRSREFGSITHERRASPALAVCESPPSHPTTHTHRGIGADCRERSTGR
jgi:hypothetical protein